MRSFDDKSLQRKSATTLNGLELKQLLSQLQNIQNICFRFRLMGEMWTKNLMKVSALNEKTVLLFDDVENRYHLVKVNNIMQFEIDGRFQTFQPHFHYDVTPSPELE